MRQKLALVLFFVGVLVGPQTGFSEAGWDNGFNIKSEDGAFKMNIGGRMQVQSYASRRQGNPNKALQSTNNAVRATTSADKFDGGFKVRRARIQTIGTLYDIFDWYVIANAGTGTSGTNTTWFAWGAINFPQKHSVSFGMVQVPMDRLGESSSAWTLGVEPNILATQEDGLKDLTIARDSLSSPFDLGVRLDGVVTDHFEYALAVVNGNGFQSTNTNNELSWGARGQFNILEAVPYKETDFAWSETPKLSVGFGSVLEDEDAQDENNKSVTRKWSWTSSADAAFHYAGFSLNTALYFRNIKLTATTTEDVNNNKKLRDVGYYGNVGYFVIPKKLELMLTGAQIFREGPDNNANEFGGGVNWYIRDNKIKCQLDYTNVLDYDDIPGLDNATYHKFRLMFSMFI